MEHCRLKNPPDSPGDLSEWTATAINSCEPSTSNQSKTPRSEMRSSRAVIYTVRTQTGSGGQRIPVSVLQPDGRLQLLPGCRGGSNVPRWRRFAPFTNGFMSNGGWKWSAKLNLMSGASKSHLAQHVTQRSVSPEVHSTYYLITGLNYRYRLTCPRRFPFGNS